LEEGYGLVKSNNLRVAPGHAALGVHRRCARGHRRHDPRPARRLAPSAPITAAPAAVVAQSRDFQARAAEELTLLPEGSALAEMPADHGAIRAQVWPFAEPRLRS
jgi:hypothetical protein